MSSRVTTDRDSVEPEGRWTVMPSRAEAPEKRPWEEPAVHRLTTRTVTRRQLEEGYEVVHADGRVERREFRVLAYIVEDPSAPGA